MTLIALWYHTLNILSLYKHSFDVTWTIFFSNFHPLWKKCLSVQSLATSFALQKLRLNSFTRKSLHILHRVSQWMNECFLLFVCHPSFILSLTLRLACQDSDRVFLKGETWPRQSAAATVLVPQDQHHRVCVENTHVNWRLLFFSSRAWAAETASPPLSPGGAPPPRPARRSLLSTPPPPRRRRAGSATTGRDLTPTSVWSGSDTAACVTTASSCVVLSLDQITGCACEIWIMSRDFMCCAQMVQRHHQKKKSC